MADPSEARFAAARQLRTRLFARDEIVVWHHRVLADIGEAREEEAHDVEGLRLPGGAALGIAEAAARDVVIGLARTRRFIQ